jgi:hypothetical protein
MRIEWGTRQGISAAVKRIQVMGREAREKLNSLSDEIPESEKWMADLLLNTVIESWSTS